MRLIDKTPFLEEDGTINPFNRIQGTLKYGFSWYGNLQAQSNTVAFFEKQFDNKFTLIRNHTLGASQITIPLILVGTSGIYVFVVSNLEGTYRAKGSSWGKVESGKYKEAGINLSKRTVQFAKAVDIYLQKQGIELPKPITPILLLINPRMHLETVRPDVRIVRSDALERFAVELRQIPPIMAREDVHSISEAVINPLRKIKPIQFQAKGTADGTPMYDLYGDGQAITESSAFGDIDFSFDGDEERPAVQKKVVPAAPAASVPARPRHVAKKSRKLSKSGLFGMTNKQLIILATMVGLVALMLFIVIIAALISL